MVPVLFAALRCRVKVRWRCAAVRQRDACALLMVLGISRRPGAATSCVRMHRAARFKVSDKLQCLFPHRASQNGSGALKMHAAQRCGTAPARGIQGLQVPE